MTAPTAPPSALDDGVALLAAYCTELIETRGYRRVRVDTLADPDNWETVRHAYAGGEWRLTVTRKNSRHTIKYTVDSLPSLAELVDATLNGPRAKDADRFDARMEMVLRGR